MIDRRLIEVAFPLEQTSIDSVHEKSVRHGHISTLHIWPARRPLAACRAALIATLLHDPGTPEKRQELVERLGGRIVKVVKKKQGLAWREEKIVKETVGGILHWGRETENNTDLDFFREEIRKACGGRAPRVLDPFAGGGAIPLEAMRLGCEVTAIDINPVAWFILKCTLEYPQKLAGQKRPLPEFVRGDRDFMETFFKAQGMKGAMLRSQLHKLGLDKADDRREKQAELKDVDTGRTIEMQIEEHTLEADLAWHVRAWGWWVLREARRELAAYYPVYADWQPLKDVDAWRAKHSDEAKPMQLVPLRDDGTPDVDALNASLPPEHLDEEKQPRWVAKPPVAYLWARTVTCKHCRATIPLLKTRWLAKKDTKRVLLTMEPNGDRTGVVFGIEADVPTAGGNNAQRREHDRRLGQGTMSRSGAWCPSCGRPGTVAMESADLRAEAVSGRMGSLLTTVVVDGVDGKEYRLPTGHEVQAAVVTSSGVEAAFADLPFGLPTESVPQGGSRSGGGSPFTVYLYGLTTWATLFTDRQLLTLAAIVRHTRNVPAAMGGADSAWALGVTAYLALAVDRLADYSSNLCSWHVSGQKMSHTFARFALPILWDFAEVAPLSKTTGSYDGGLEWISRFISTAMQAARDLAPTVRCQSAQGNTGAEFDVVLTDPPYYDAIPYSDLMDFFYVWLRRTLTGLDDRWTEAFARPLGPKWDRTLQDGELIDDASRFAGDAGLSKSTYETGMERVFQQCSLQLADMGRIVVVFANKQPDAWETLVSASIRAGFTVDGSWPIRTEMGTRQRALAAAALASSVWLVCKKRPASAKPGWDNKVLQEMQANITEKLREFWDAGIHGPDFVWAATGPALEAYSKHPFVKKANAPGETMSVGEFLRAVRRIVVEFVVGRVLGEAAHASAEASNETAASLDDVTTYYLLHRHDFGTNDAPAGACILYALSCNLSESDLADRYDLLTRTGGLEPSEDGDAVENGEADAEGEAEEGSGSTFKLKPWKQRRRATLGTDPIAERARLRRLGDEEMGQPLFDDMAPEARPASGKPRVVPVIDMIHHLMHLWVDGDVAKVNEYLDNQGLRKSETFRQVLQALIELAGEGSEERSVLERLSNHVQARGQAVDTLFDGTRG